MTSFKSNSILFFLALIFGAQIAPLSFAAQNSKADVQKILQECDKNLRSLDVNNRKLIGKISVTANSTPCSSAQSPLPKSFSNLEPAMQNLKVISTQNDTDQLLDLVNDDALKKSIEAFMNYSVTRTLNPKTNKPYDLNNVQDIIVLRAKLCGFDNPKHCCPA